MRGSAALPRWILIAPSQAARGSSAAQAARGEPTAGPAPGRVFTDRADAERYVFDLRWQALTGPAVTADE